MKKVIAIVGFGSMGCRHAQALLSERNKYEIHIIEPSEKNIDQNLEKIGAQREHFTWHKNTDSLPFIDCAILATSSSPRFKLVKELLQKNIKFFLLEKIVFQSAAQFEEVIMSLEDYKAVAYCNFVNRYFNAYNELKTEIASTKEPVLMQVYGGEFGLGCNAIHYVDIFQFITGRLDIQSMKSSIYEIPKKNHRGLEYKEFAGYISIRNNNLDKLDVISDREYTGGVIINVNFKNKSYLLSEQSQKVFSLGGHYNTSDFKIIPTSKLTSRVISDIFDNVSPLTQVSDTYNAHKHLFEHFNICLFGLHTDTSICPIT